MGVLDKTRRLAARLLGRGGDTAKAGGKRVVRIARLPTRIFADGSIARGVASSGLYGLARITVDEAELSCDPGRDSDAGTGDSPASPLNSRSKYYAVVSVGRQTFTSKRVRRAGARPSAAALASAGAGDGSADGGAAGGEEVAVFKWDEGTDVVLQRGGATVAQVAIYKQGRIDGALGDKLQCWATLDLAKYFDEAAEAPAEAPPPPADLLVTAAGEGDSLTFSESEEIHLEAARHQQQHLQAEGTEQQPGAAAASGAAPAPAAAPSRSASRTSSGGASRYLSCRSLHLAGGGEVLQDDWLPLVDPGDASRVCGWLRLTVRASTLEGMEQQLWRRLLPLADLNGDGRLTQAEFGALLEAMGSDLSHEEAEALFRQADADGSGDVDADELAAALTACHKEGDFHRLMRRCPVDGAELLPNDDVANLMYVTLAMDEGTGESLRGGYTTPEQVSRSWLLSMTEWATQPLAGAPKALWKGNKYSAGGLRQGAAAAHILIFDRRTKRVVEEAVSPALTLAMRAMYQSRVGKLVLRREGVYRQLRKMTDKYGAYADSPESAADIPKFLAAFRGQVDMQESLEPNPAAYRCFNDFFYRRLKDSARPIAAREDPTVVVSAADCRLMVYNTVDDATRCWIKGRRFSIAGLLGDTTAASGAPSGSKAADGSAKSSASSSRASSGSLGASGGGGGGGEPSAMAGKAAEFAGGSMAIFRLAPQDYHRFHLPVGGTVLAIVDIPGELLTVNPIAVNSTFADVFTRNQRSVLLLQAPGYGLLAYVAIGATVVGSIRWTVEVGSFLPKGAEAGYFAFGGSTVVLLFQAGAVAWDADLVENSLNSLETRVLMGERLGRQASAEGQHKDGGAEAADA